MCPQNVGSMPDADARGAYGDPSCGDSLMMFLKVDNNTIKEIRYLVFGCCAAIASASMTSVLAKGKSLQAAEKITDEDVLKALGGLPQIKAHCSNVGVVALQNVIKNYKNSL